jgi:hypothetical protein
MGIRLVTLAACIAICGCTGYGPPRFDETTGLYDIKATVAKESIAKRETRANLKKYRFVWLVTRTYYFPQRTEFLVREALAHSGFTQVLNTHELTDLVTTTPEFSWVATLSDPVTQRRLTEILGPIAGVSLSHLAGDEGVRLLVTDIATGTTLLDVRYTDFAIANDRFYPVFNELKKWADECNATRENT